MISFLLLLAIASSGTEVEAQHVVLHRLGCFNGETWRSPRPLPSNENAGHSELVWWIWRNNPIGNCKAVALKLGHNVFALKNKDCFSTWTSVPGGAYARYGQSWSCPSNGFGGSSSYEVYQLHPLELPQQSLLFENLGCVADNAASPALGNNEGKGHPELIGAAATRPDAINRCYRVAMRLGHNVFGLQDGNCFSALDTVPGGGFGRYGPASQCPTSGLGAPLVTNVYQAYNSRRSEFSNLGCFRHNPSDLALPSNEGKGHPELVGLSSSRPDAIARCSQVAMKLGHNVFAIQNGACFSRVDTVPGGNYTRHGRMSPCPSNGLGGMVNDLLVNNVYQLNATVLPQRVDYLNLGCFHDDASAPAIPTSENKGYPELIGHHSSRANPVQQCFQVARRLRHTVFAVQNGACYSMADTVPGGSYLRYGPSSYCPSNGLGTALVNNVYQVNGGILNHQRTDILSVGCFKDNVSSPALQSNEGKNHSELIGSPASRVNATDRCFQVAMKLKHNVFAIQNGSCFSSNDVWNGSYARYGPTNVCPTTGTSTALANHVYHIHPTLLPQRPDVTNLGCFWDNPNARALPSNEGKGYPDLDGVPAMRTNATEKCLHVALKLYHNIFAVQNGSCYSAVDSVPAGNYARYGISHVCPLDGNGDQLVNNVYNITRPLVISDYTSLGCFRDVAATPALRSNEGQGHPELDGTPANRAQAIRKCFQVALRLMHTVFAIQNGACFSMVDSVPGGSYARYNASATCPQTGLGATLINHVYQVHPSRLTQRSNFFNLGCFRDNLASPALQSNENKGHPELDGSSVRCVAVNLTPSAGLSSVLRTGTPTQTCTTIITRANATEKCFQVALKLRHNVFAVQNGSCFSAPDTVPNGLYARYGSSDMCPSSGFGSALISNVYQINASLLTQRSDLVNLGCFTDSTFAPALPSNEGKGHIELIGEPATRINATERCFQVAVRLGHPVFAIQNGSCFSFNDTVPGGSYSKYGPSTTCPTNGLGARFINNVYQVHPSLLPQRSDYLNLGCFLDNPAAPALQSLEGYPDLDGSHVTRLNATEKCFRAAMKSLHNVFALQNGACFSGNMTVPGGGYARYGVSAVCPTNGLGANAINNVYQIKNLIIIPAYKNLGCFRDDASVPALRRNEGMFSELSDNPVHRRNAFEKCFMIARHMEHNVFALQNGSCFSMSDVVPNGDYARYGNAPSCPESGLGATLVNNVYHIPSIDGPIADFSNLPYVSGDCWIERPLRTVHSFEGDPLLGPNPSKRLDAINKCYQVALKNSALLFGISDGGDCRGNPISSRARVGPVWEDGYWATNYGPSTYCPKDGKGASRVTQFYSIKEMKQSNITTVLVSNSAPYSNLGCWLDSNETTRKALRLNEGTDTLLWGDFQAREDAVKKCYQVAESRGHNVFALQNGGECYSMLDIVPGGSYSLYGKLNDTQCPVDGKGARNINQVYEVQRQLSTYYYSLGCWDANRNMVHRVGRSDPDQCYLVAKRLGHSLFGLNNGNCFTAADPYPERTYSGQSRWPAFYYCPENIGRWHFYSVFAIRDTPETPRVTTPFVSLGCWRDSNEPTRKALRLNEGLFSSLDGDYRYRGNAIMKCYQTAVAAGHNVFALQDGGQCYSSLDIVPNGDYAMYGNSSFCPRDAKGALNINHVFQINGSTPLVPINTTTAPFVSLGCWNDSNDTSLKALRLNEGVITSLDGHYRSRRDAIMKCYHAAASLGHNVFALQNSGECYSLLDVVPNGDYARYGTSSFCPRDGKGGVNVNHVYQIKGATNVTALPSTVPYTSLGCWRDSSDPARKNLRLNEGRFSGLDSHYRIRRDAINKCYTIALSLGHNIFGVQDGGQCYSMLDLPIGGDYARLGNTSFCPRDGKGSINVNHVYRINSITTIPPQVNATLYRSLGCWNENTEANLPAVRLNEGLYPTILDSVDYRLRVDAINKCYRVAVQRKHNVFALQDNGKCHSSLDLVPGGTYSLYGNSSYCPRDGRGGFNVNHVYSIINATGISLAWNSLPYTSMGCFRDRVDDTADIFDSNEASIGGDHRFREDAVNKCYLAARARNVNVFLVQDGGKCFSGFDIIPGGDYMKDGTASYCPLDGLGGKNVNHAYRINGAKSKVIMFADLPYVSVAKGTHEYTSLACWKDSPNPNEKVFRLAERLDPILDGNPADRADAVQKCFQVAKKRGHNLFGVQAGACYSIVDSVGGDYTKFGRSERCPASGKGSININHVYHIKGEPTNVSAVPASAPYVSLGCFEENVYNLRLRDGTHPSVNEKPEFRYNPIRKCYEVALRHGHTVFGLLENGACYTGLDNPVVKPSKYTGRCPIDGLGFQGSFHVYRNLHARMDPQSAVKISQAFNSTLYTSLGCWKENPTLNPRTMQLQEVVNKKLTVYPPDARASPISACYEVAVSLGHNIFALQDEGSCLTGLQFLDGGTYTNFGTSTSCLPDGFGHRLVNHVYRVNNAPVYDPYAASPPWSWCNCWEGWDNGLQIVASYQTAGLRKCYERLRGHELIAFDGVNCGTIPSSRLRMFQTYRTGSGTYSFYRLYGCSRFMGPVDPERSCRSSRYRITVYHVR